MAEDSKCSCKATTLSPTARALIFWVLCLFSVLVNGSSLSSTTNSPWATYNSGGNSVKAGLWKYYNCGTTCDAGTTYPTDSACYKYGIGAGVILIVVISFSILAFFFRLSVICCKGPKWMNSFKAFMILKSFFGIAGPAVAIAIWTKNCLFTLPNQNLVWSVGPGILILSMVFEIAALYGIRQAWDGGAGTKSAE